MLTLEWIYFVFVVTWIWLVFAYRVCHIFIFFLQPMSKDFEFRTYNKFFLFSIRSEIRLEISEILQNYQENWPICFWAIHLKFHWWDSIFIIFENLFVCVWWKISAQLLVPSSKIVDYNVKDYWFPFRWKRFHLLVISLILSVSQIILWNFLVQIPGLIWLVIFFLQGCCDDFLMFHLQNIFWCCWSIH